MKPDATNPHIFSDFTRSLLRVFPAVLVTALALVAFTALASEKRLNVLFITADDMNYNTPGVTGCLTPDITPNLDRLASQGMRFVNAHVTVAVCQPSRECLMTGRYPHRNGATGFYPVRQDVPTLAESLKAAGYQLGIMAKVSHLAPDNKFPWDYKYDARRTRPGPRPGPLLPLRKGVLRAGQEIRQAVLPHGQLAGPAPSLGRQRRREEPGRRARRASRRRRRRPRAAESDEDSVRGRSRSIRRPPHLQARGGRRARLPAGPARRAQGNGAVLFLGASVRRDRRRSPAGAEGVGPGGQHAGDVPERQRHLDALRQEQLLSDQHPHALAGALAGQGQGRRGGHRALHLGH